jgi:hypothetical protein
MMSDTQPDGLASLADQRKRGAAVDARTLGTR